MGETAAESTKQLLKQKKFSRKINYAAIDSLLNDTGSASKGEEGGEDNIDERRNNLFDEEDPWETGSVKRSRSRSRSASRAPSEDGRRRRESSVSSTYSTISNGTSGTTRKRKRSSMDSTSTDIQAEKLRAKLLGSDKSSPPSSMAGKGKSDIVRKLGGVLGSSSSTLRNANLSSATSLPSTSAPGGKKFAPSLAFRKGGSPSKARGKPVLVPRGPAEEEVDQNEGAGEEDTRQEEGEGPAEPEEEDAQIVNDDAQEPDEEEEEEEDEDEDQPAADEDDDDDMAEFNRMRRRQSEGDEGDMDDEW